MFNSNHKKIISDKVTPDLSDFHQKISPKSGYIITDKSGQHSSQIKVCAGQPASGGEHTDCFNIKQNKVKTYWYSVFDYPLIEGFEDD